MTGKIPDADYEIPFWEKRLLVAGIDEAGRGPLAGPVVAAAVILMPMRHNPGFADSKKLSEKRRAELLPQIYEQSYDVKTAFISNNEIDAINIRRATLQAMTAALDALSPQPYHALIDGNFFLHETIPFTAIVDGDAKCLSIAAASIAAKSARDRWMIETADVRYPEYGFAQHKGYGVKSHIEALKKFGPCPLHRLTFLRKLFDLKHESLFQEHKNNQPGARYGYTCRLMD
ncbi:ribonuclease HII [Ignavibacteria bacterium]|nr:ribonuclease HII [Bacteroidota bacterium]MCZ2133452.1 ribonuclease HII [Bacteroidota bacterium]